jgi:muconolactone delta-isomerase
MEFLVEFEVEVPDGARASEVEERTRAEASAAARLADEGRLLRIWRRAAVADDVTVIGLYAADSEAELEDLLRGLPLAEWMQVTVTPLAPHPNDPSAAERKETHVSATGSLSFAEDIKPLFREGDRDSMISQFDLWSYDDVARASEAILARLKDGSMPCDGAWPDEQVALFEQWVAAGKPA